MYPIKKLQKAERRRSARRVGSSHALSQPTMAFFSVLKFAEQ